MRNIVLAALPVFQDIVSGLCSETAAGLLRRQTLAAPEKSQVPELQKPKMKKGIIKQVFTSLGCQVSEARLVSHTARSPQGMQDALSGRTPPGLPVELQTPQLSNKRRPLLFLAASGAQQKKKNGSNDIGDAEIIMTFTSMLASRAVTQRKDGPWIFVLRKLIIRS